MSALKSAAPPVPAQREYDPEIKDMANYIHNTPIDSELAVRLVDKPMCIPLANLVFP
jgi:2-methylcitrate dehydratase